MSERSCIFIYGQSIFLQAIIAGLQRQPNIDLHKFDPHHPLIGTLLRQAKPTLLIIEVGGDEDWLMGDLLAGDIPILVVDIGTGQSKLLTSEPLPIQQGQHPKMKNLAALINQIELIHSVDTQWESMTA